VPPVWRSRGSDPRYLDLVELLLALSVGHPQALPRSQPAHNDKVLAKLSALFFRKFEIGMAEIKSESVADLLRNEQAKNFTKVLESRRKWVVH
jgi:hypothetical protein